MHTDTVQRAHVDLRRDEYIVWSASRTTSGIWRMNGAFRRVAVNALAGELAATIDWALSQSRTGTPDIITRRGPSPFQPVLDALNLSSYGGYTRGTRSVAVERVGAMVSVIPHLNRGPRFGFSAVLEKTVQLERPSPGQMMSGVVQALALDNPSE